MTPGQRVGSGPELTQQDRLREEAPAPLEGTVTLLFTDLVGSTELLERLGDDRAEELRRAHFAALRDAAVAHGGHEVKSVGDGLMVAFRSAVDALGAAVQMQRAVDRHNREGAQPIAVRIGLAVGEVVYDQGDYYGTPVVVAKRLCDAAAGGEILVSELIRGLVGSRGGYAFQPVGGLRLKGLAEPLEAAKVAWAGPARPPVRPATDPAPGAARIRGPFVGRRAESRELSAALDAAHGGHGSILLLAGEAGVGKTRLAEEVAEMAAAQGDTVLWGRAWEAGGAPAYWPWTQIIRELLHHRPADEVIEDLGWGAPYVGQIAPEVGRRPPASNGHEDPLDSEAARFSTFDATASFLRAAAARRPIVVVLDDLHAADVATVRLLEFLARTVQHARILAIATHREGAECHSADVAAALADLGRAARRLVLCGLSREEVLELAAAQAPDPPPPPLVDRLHVLTEGNPLFVDEVIRLLAAEGALAEPGALAPGRLAVPEGVRDTIRRRLDPLAPSALRILTAAAVIGPEFRLEALARVLAADRSALLGELEAAAQAGLVEARQHALGSYRFAHALIREVLYDDLAAQDRVALHAAVGAALLELHGDGPDAPLSELAHHFVEAAPAGNPARAVDYAARAGERALHSTAYEQAVELFADALRALELQPREAARRG